ncbi:MAG: hypothetical protein A2360_00240 [Candidatus Staskawiczbacteria bacterium RIFOXYB1_FULL_32_11]|uniref:ATP-grasp domain-containing protein n=1 Tax=Candidatus Staskawiczbacteria bacterium RIFOXYD1_FULL_32_13 TaxID=1802234 RepID=A0A1G2JQJ4_9BACT|nr:MAG: hypothetical protein UR22_C0002G0015 [Parcubacteria group bacterium GW2011_GWC2_32_10]OGZ80188.1 MAG: hypothetical protein A2360_00240 [Candidatus Staskawiczbacteria bacterium RIFOXYB1_FULL_32_11]OGZ88711.1 MAG: hypothetical protein A2561_03045 [Candidatus Staskawiczbacteria bacterium RIFOXYD1_FULL_32_13]
MANLYFDKGVAVINFYEFVLNSSVVAKKIYREDYHFTTNRGVVISHEVRIELKRLLSSFNNQVGIEKTPYYRIDAFFDDESLWILEINASFVDGWGTALNLARAGGIRISSELLTFPTFFASKSWEYMPELELFVDELARLGLSGHHIHELHGNGVDSTYVYGRVGSKDQPNILPYDGLRLDNKLNLGLLSRGWDSVAVKIPRHYINRFDSWEEIPTDVVLKFCDKSSLECKQTRQSVLFDKPSGKAPFIRRCYREEKLVAQNFVQPVKQNGSSCQLVILAIGEEPITGYVQYSRERIINDNSVHGPLQFV